MAAETELKLFFQPEHQEALINLLDKFPHSTANGAKRLSNGYFDTPQLQLRQWDMGLRVRGIEAFREQTIKTAGKTVGGIHSRPEYNVTIEQDFPNLQLFPREIWPKDCELAALQAQLSCLFHTDFTRQTWHVTVDESLVEVALDMGEIRAGEQGKLTEPLCELEFELLAGQPSALLVLARAVAASVPVRLGKASKAQRGYRLAAQSSPLMLEALEFIALAPEHSIKQVLLNVLETGLERWQLIEAMIFESTEDYLHCADLFCRLRACVRLLKLTLVHFNLLDEAAEQAFENIEAQLAFIEPAKSLSDVLADHKAALSKLAQGEALLLDAEEKLHSFDFYECLASLWTMPCYGQLQLQLVALLFAVEHDELVINAQVSVKDFADGLQQKSWERILALMPPNVHLSSEDYQSIAKALNESMLVGFAYGQLYPEKARDSFRRPWFDLAKGINTLASYAVLAQCSEHQGVDIRDWLENKQQSLLVAMEHSRRSAINAEPYWG